VALSARGKTRLRTVRVSLFGVPAHPVVNDFPGSLLPLVSVCDLLYLLRGDPSWAVAGFRMLQLGNVSGLLAALLGLLDLLRLPPVPEVRRHGLTHGATNAVVLPLFLLAQLERRRRPYRPSFRGIALALVANVGLNIAAWHGARMVHAHSVRTGERERPVPIAATPEVITWLTSAK
jgi:uncharacterized membrane protein